MKKIEEVLFIVQARLGSSRVPSKMIRPFAGKDLTSIVLEKLKESQAPRSSIYLSAYETEIKEIAKKQDVNLFHRSLKSATWDGGPDVSEIFEWWDKLPFKYVIMVSGCVPMLRVETINRFIDEFLSSDNDAMFGVHKKKNYIWNTEGMPINNQQITGAPDTKKVLPFYEASHCLYAASMNKIGNNIWMGDLTKPGDVDLFEIEESEVFDIDYEWQFEVAEQIYLNKKEK